MKYAWIHEMDARRNDDDKAADLWWFSVSLACHVLEVSTSGFYDWRDRKDRPPTEAERALARPAADGLGMHRDGLAAVPLHLLDHAALEVGGVGSWEVADLVAADPDADAVAVVTRRLLGGDHRPTVRKLRRT